MIFPLYRETYMSGTSGTTQSHIPISPGSFSEIKGPKAIPINTLDKKTLDTAHGILESYNNNTWSKPEALSERSITQEHLHDTPTNDEIDYDALAQEIDFSFDMDEPKSKNGSPIEKEIKPNINSIAQSNEEEIDFDALAQEIDFSFDIDEPKPKNGSPTEKGIKPDTNSKTLSNEEEIDYDALAQEIDFSFDMDEPKSKNGSPTEKEINPDTNSKTLSNEEEIDFDALAQEIDFSFDIGDFNNQDIQIDSDFLSNIDLDKYSEFYHSFIKSHKDWKDLDIKSYIEPKTASKIDSHSDKDQPHIDSSKLTLSNEEILKDFLGIDDSWDIALPAIITHTDPINSQKYVLKEDIEGAPDILLNQYKLQLKEKMFRHQNNIYIKSPAAFFLTESTLDENTISELATLSKEDQAAFLDAYASGKIKKIDLVDLEQLFKSKANLTLSRYLLSQNIKIISSKSELDKILEKTPSFNPRRESSYEIQNSKLKDSHQKGKLDKNILDNVHNEKTKDASKVERKRANNFQLNIEQKQTEKRRKFYEELGELEKIKERRLQLILKEELTKSEFIHQFQYALNTKKRNFHIKRVPSAT
ncbi:MAG: hypothetical protein QRY74_05480 [Chlamydia sp.]